MFVFTNAIDRLTRTPAQIAVAALMIFSSSLATAESTQYKVDGITYEGYFLNKGKTAPTVFIIHDWDGLTEYEIKRAQMLSDLGFSVFAIDLFGQGVRPKEEADKKAQTGALYSDRKKMRKLLNASLAHAKKLGLDVKNSSVAGYCFGGAAALEWARSGAPLKGFVSFHGGLETPEGQNYKSTKGKVLILHGTADSAVTMEHFANIAKELESTKVNHEMITYSGAPHAFTVFGSERYREDADKKSWARYTEFLKELNL
jgi:dienelactone hydrolase